MGNNISVKVIAYGVPALLIVLGFIAWMGGSIIDVIVGNSGAKDFGGILIFLGIVIFLLVIYLDYKSNK